MKYIIGILVSFLFLPISSFAQSKPKRDVSKDKSAVVAKQRQEQAAKYRANLEAKRKQTNKSKSRRARPKRKYIPIVREATFLTVDHLTAPSKTLESNGGTISFDVNTDGEKWTVTGLPKWCWVSTKYPNRFVVTYHANPTHDDRSDWFYVKSDNKCVRVNVLQQAAPLNVQAKVSSVYLTHNVKAGPKMLKIDANVTISGAAGQKCWVEANILDEYGQYVKAENGYKNFTSPNGNVCSGYVVIPQTDQPETFHVVNYIPNNAMKLAKKNNKLRCYIVVYCARTDEICANYTLYFRATRKRGAVKTKAYR